MEKAAEKFGFSLQDVLAVVCDNASNVVTALRILRGMELSHINVPYTSVNGQGQGF